MNATFNEVTGNVKLIHSKANSLLPPKANGDAFNICQESNLGSHTMTIVNQYNGLSHSSRTVATLNSGMENGEFESFTSDNLVNLIGQENYNVLFAALCTISSTDLKRKAIRTLLTKQTISKKYSEISVQTPNWDRQYILTHDVSCQTLGKLVKDKSVNTDSTQDFQTNSSSFTTRQFKKRRRCPTRRQSPYVIDTRNFVNKIDHKKMITERDMKLEYQQNIVVHRRKISMPPPSGKFSEDSGYSSLKGVQGNDEKIGVHAKEDFKEDNVKSLNVTSTELEKVYLNKVTKTTENITYKSFNIFDNDNGTEIGSTIGTSVCSEPFDISESILNDPIGPLERYLPSVTKPIEFVMNDDEREVPELVESNPPLPESRQEPFNYGKPNLNNEIQELLNGVKPEDKFHLVPKESANTMSPDRLKRLINHQMIVDWEYCLHPDELGYLPIHNAVLNNDIPWLQRQCLVLKSKGENVDVGDEQTGMSALQLAVNEHSNISCIKVLLKHGANMFYKDDRSSTVLHYCIESEDEQYTNYFIIYMEQNPKIILEAAGLKTLEEKEENKQLVLRYANSIYDENGLTPLMLAAKLGRPHSIDSLLETVGDPTELVNMRCAKSGDTALMLAVKSASAAGFKQQIHSARTIPEDNREAVLVRGGP